LPPAEDFRVKHPQYPVQLLLLVVSIFDGDRTPQAA
jgi:hypothetical protein